MSSSSCRENSSPLRVAPPDVQVINWPLWDEGWRAQLLLIALVGVAIGVGWKLNSVAHGLLAAVALAVAAWRLWLPVTWELNCHGVTETVLGRSIRIPWASIGGWREYRSGVLLLPEPDTAPLLALRGRFIAWRNQGTEVITVLEYYVGRSVGHSPSANPR